MLSDSLRDLFVGGDPIAGRNALIELLAHGDAGEELLFAAPIRVPTVQAKRRWLAYVATRPKSVGPKLLARIRGDELFEDGTTAAELFVGLPPSDPMHERIARLQAADFERGTPNIGSRQDYQRASSTMAAVGASRTTPWQLWHAVNGDDYAWEKLRHHAFRSACVTAARFGQEHCGLVESFLTRDGLQQSREQIEPRELWLQAYYKFALWRSGSLVDAIFSRWSTHQDPRLRNFGAMILSALCFRRAQGPLQSWIARESDADVRSTLVDALAHCRTSSAADALLELEKRGVATDSALAAGAQYATDQAMASSVLERIASGNDTSSSEALVAMARLGVASTRLPAALFSSDEYRRVNAALAYGILSDRSRLADLVAMQSESSSPIESVYVAAALAMFGHEGACNTLHERLSQFAVGWLGGGELFHLKPALKQAILTAFERGGAAAETFLRAWKAELEPLETVIRPVDVSHGWPAPAAAPAAIATTALVKASSVVIAHRKVPERFRVAFSFAGAQRSRVAEVAEAIERRLGRGVVFLDDWFQAYVAGNDADILLQRIYGQKSDLVVMCVASAYDDRPWTMIEHRALRMLTWGAKAGSKQAMRVMPLRFGDGDVEGVLSNTIVPDVRRSTVDEAVELIVARLRLLD